MMRPEEEALFFDIILAVAKHLEGRKGYNSTLAGELEMDLGYVVRETIAKHPNIPALPDAGVTA